MSEKKTLGPIELNRIYQMDCIEGMRLIPDKSVDMILCDLPYGTTACKWDTIIPFKPLWEQYRRVIKDNGAIVLTAAQPFTSSLIMSNIGLFKYALVWNKVNASSGLHAKSQPLRSHEDILIFGKGKVFYNPQMEQAEKRRVDKERDIPNGEAFNGKVKKRVYDNKGLKYPKSIITISNANQRDKVHPTQKPLALFEYLVKTYTSEGDTVLDNCMGSGTTAVAALRTNRNFIGFERESEYVRIANQRIENVRDEIAERKLTENTEEATDE
jgi:site-specific DNA-methyltransferase (adenine-specific)